MGQRMHNKTKQLGVAAAVAAAAWAWAAPGVAFAQDRTQDRAQSSTQSSDQGAAAGLPSSYLSVGVASARVGVACGASYSCESHRLGGHLRVGAPLSPGWQLDLGIARLEGVEVGYSALGSSEQTRTVRKRVFVGTGSSVLRNVQEKVDVSATAITFDTLTRAPLTDDLSLWLRVGVAAVATTAKSYDNGISLGSVTENHAAPHLGLGLDWAMAPNVALSAGLDSTRVSADGHKGRSRSLHLGVKLGF